MQSTNDFLTMLGVHAHLLALPGYHPLHKLAAFDAALADFTLRSQSLDYVVLVKRLREDFKPIPEETPVAASKSKVGSKTPAS